MAEESLQLRESAKELRLATRDLQAFNQSAGAEIAKTIGGDLKKGILDPFLGTFQAIPGVSTLGSIGKSLGGRFLAARREKREQELLRKQLGLSVEQFQQMKAQKRVIDAQKKFADKIGTAADNLLGLDVKQFNNASMAIKGVKGRRSTADGIDILIDRQDETIRQKERELRFGNKNKAREVAEENRKERKEEATMNIFQQIADNIKGLAKGADDMKKSGFLGKMLDALFLPLGAVGAIVGAFVTGFVDSVKKDFKPLFSRLGTIFRGLKLRVSSLIAPPFRRLFGEKGPAGGFFKFLGDTVDSVKTNFTKAKDALSKNLFIRTINNFADRIGKIARGVFGIFTNVVGRIREAGRIAKDLPVIAQITRFAANIGRILGKFALPITIIIGVFDTVTGAIEGWRESEGDSLISKSLDAIGEGLGKLFGNLLGFFPELFKDAISFIVKKAFGVKTDAEGNIIPGQGLAADFVSFLDSFDFKTLIRNIISYPFNLLSDVVDKIGDFFTNFSIKDSLNELKGYINDLAPRFFKRLLRGILPSPDFLKFEIPSNKATEFFGIAGKGGDFNPIPKGVYEFAGINYDTGEIEGPKPTTRDTINLGRAGLQEEFFKARREGDIEKMEDLIREAEDQRQNNMTINQIYNQQDMSQKSSVNQFSSEGISDNGAPIGAFVSGPG